eukprot:CFRG4881T1
MSPLRDIHTTADEMKVEVDSIGGQSDSVDKLKQLDNRIDAFAERHKDAIDTVRSSTCPAFYVVPENERLSWDWLPSLHVFAKVPTSQRRDILYSDILNPGQIVEGVVVRHSSLDITITVTAILIVIDGATTKQQEIEDNNNVGVSTANSSQDTSPTCGSLGRRSRMVGRRALRCNDLETLGLTAQILGSPSRSNDGEDRLRRYDHYDGRRNRSSSEDRDNDLGIMFKDCRRGDVMRAVIESVDRTNRLITLRLQPMEGQEALPSNLRLGRVKGEEKNFNIEYENCVPFNRHFEKVYDFHNPRLLKEMESILGLDLSYDTLLTPSGRETYPPEDYVENLRSEQNRRRAHDLVSRGVVIMKKGGSQSECLAMFDEALLVCPDYIEALVARGVLHMQYDRMEQAVKDLTQAVALSPTHANAVKYLTATLSKRAKRRITPYIPRSRQDEKQQSAGGQMKERQSIMTRDLEMSMADLQRVLELAPGHTEATDLVKLIQQKQLEAAKHEADRKKALLRAAVAALEASSSRSQDRERKYKKERKQKRSKHKKHKRQSSSRSTTPSRPSKRKRKSSKSKSGREYPSSKRRRRTASDGESDPTDSISSGNESSS